MSQKPDQWLASKFKGTDVIGADSKTIGDVTDILFDKTGKIEGYVISVGGFLGMGSKEVALAPSSFEVVPGQNGATDKLRTLHNQGRAQAGAELHALSATASGDHHRHGPASAEGRFARRRHASVDQHAADRKVSVLVQSVFDGRPTTAPAVIQAAGAIHTHASIA